MNTNNIPHRKPDAALDMVLHDELHCQVPMELTQQLLHLVQVESSVLQQQASVATEADQWFCNDTIYPMAQPKPRTWYTILVMALTFALVWVSSLVFWQLSGAFGLADVWSQIQTIALNGLQQLYVEFPATETLVSFLKTMYQQTYGLLNWVLVAIILWFALDTYAPTSSYQQQPTP